MNHIEEMDPKSMLTKALSAGAVAMLRPNLKGRHESQREIAHAYEKLKLMLEEKYGQVDADLMDIGPASAERKELIAQQLEASGATEDESILRQAQRVLEIIAEENPESLWASEVPEIPPHLR